MNLKALQCLVAIHDSQSFLEAARRLGFKQSSVSMHIKALEDELGVALFDRSVRPPAMTEAAIAIVRPAREILGLVRSIAETVKAGDSLTGRLTLGVIPTASSSLLPDALLGLGRRYPGIRITVESGLSGSLVDLVLAGKLDGAVITEPPALPPELRCETILRERLMIIAAPGFKGTLGLAQSEHHPFIRFNRRVGVGEIIDRYLQRKGLHPEEHMELDSLDAILAMVERGLGIAIVPERSLGSARRDMIRLSFIDDPEASRNVSLIFHAQSAKSALLLGLLNSFRVTASAGSRLASGS